MVFLAPLVRGDIPSGRLAPVLRRIQRELAPAAPKPVKQVGSHSQGTTAAPPGKSKAIPDAVSSSVLFMKKKEALRASAEAMERFEGAVLRTQRFAVQKEAAEKEKHKAAAAVANAEARVGEAKKLRVQAAQVDLRISPVGAQHDRSERSLAAAEANVAKAQHAFVEASTAAAIAGGRAKAAEARLANATEEYAAEREALEQSHKDVEALAGAIATVEKQLGTAESSLRTQADTMSAYLGKPQFISSGSPRPASTLQGKHDGAQKEESQKEGPPDRSQVAPNRSQEAPDRSQEDDAAEDKVVASQRVLEAASSAGSRAEVFEAAVARVVGMQDAYEHTMKLSDTDVERLARKVARFQKPAAGAERQQ